MEQAARDLRAGLLSIRLGNGYHVAEPLHEGERRMHSPPEPCVGGPQLARVVFREGKKVHVIDRALPYLMCERKRAFGMIQ